MANQNAAATSWNCPNYVGELYLIGANQTPFLNQIGSLQGGNAKLVGDMQFAMAQTYALESAAQPAITETASLTKPTAWTYVRGVDYNTCHIVHKSVDVSYVKQSVVGQVTADPTTGLIDIMGGGQPVRNERDFQIQAALEQIAIDTEYTFLHGAYQQATAANVAAKTRGIVTACSTNAVAAGGAQLSRSLINQLVRTMAGNGAIFRNIMMFCNSYQRQRISEIFGYAPPSRTVGGVEISTVMVDFVMMDVVWCPQLDTGTVLLADLSVCNPVYLPVPEKGVLFYEPLDPGGASEVGQIYGQIGLDYGPEEYHGKITGLATS